MRPLFVSQSESIELFNAINTSLETKVDVEKTGFVIADSWAYLNWLETTPDFEQRGYSLLKEWEVTAQRDSEPDLSLLREYEAKIGAEPGLFGAIVADRRLFMGKDCTYKQDYRRRFTDNELLSILQQAIHSVELLFDELKPDVVISFICVTMLDYIVYLFARSRGVRFLNIRPTRISDRITLSSTLNDPTPEFLQAYQNTLPEELPFDDIVSEYLRRVRQEHGRYEGVVRPSAKPVQVVNRARRSPLQLIRHVVANYLKYRANITAADNHVASPLRASFHAAVINPINARLIAREFTGKYVDERRLRSQRYAFFPLHTEPEVSLLVYGRPFINQIEIIRTIAISLPADMILVVKEHPWMVGKRSLASYRKLLNIPKVHLANPAMEVRDLVMTSDLVTVITGSVALEAAVLGKPVVTFGDCPYNALPDCMVRYCRDLRSLPALIASLLSNYYLDEGALRAYVSAIYQTTESINLYSVLLQKKAVHAERDGSYEREVGVLADYILKWIRRWPEVLESSEYMRVW